VRRVPERPRSRAEVLGLPALALLVALGQLEAWTVDLEGSPRVVTVLAVLVATCALGLIRRSPAAAGVLVVVALVVKDAFRGPGEVLVLLLCGVLATFNVGLSLPSRAARLTLASLMALSALGVVLGDEEAPTELAFSAIVLGASWAAGRLLRASRRHAAVAEELAAVRAREAQDTARWAAAEERTRIARELHDLVGHSVSLMVIQAGAAAEVLHREPDRAAAVLDSLQSTGRGAVDDLHRVLGLLREDGARDETGPLPGLTALDDLLARFKEGGLQVQQEVTGDMASLPAGVSLTAYRVVQEALTNVVRHATGRCATLTVRREPDLLRLEVRDDGNAVAAPVPGHGLLGMSERIALYDGRLEAGPAPGGGFRVRAEIPLREAS